MSDFQGELTLMGGEILARNTELAFHSLSGGWWVETESILIPLD
jgi:hypothetical protein